jgi:hypothetical protein
MLTRINRITKLLAVILEAMLCVARIIFGIDPFGIYSLVPYIATRVLQSLLMSVGCFCRFIVFLQWAENVAILEASLSMRKRTMKLYKPKVVVALTSLLLFLVIVDMTVVIVGFVYNLSWLTQAEALIALGFNFSFSCYYLWTVYKTLRIANRIETDASEVNTGINTATIFGAAIGNNKSKSGTAGGVRVSGRDTAVKATGDTKTAAVTGRGTGAVVEEGNGLDDRKGRGESVVPQVMDTVRRKIKATSRPLMLLVLAVYVEIAILTLIVSSPYLSLI